MKLQCPKCGGKILTKSTTITKSGKYKLFQCKECKFRHSISGPDVDDWTPEQIFAYTPTVKRRLSDDDVIKIKGSSESRKDLAAQYGVSRAVILQIQKGLIYRDVLDENYRPRPGLNEPSCERCREWRGIDSTNPCAVGFPDPAIEGPGFARDCSLFHP